MDEPEETQKRPAEQKETQCEDALAFNAAVSLPGARKPLVPLDYPMDGSFGKVLPFIFETESQSVALVSLEFTPACLSLPNF